MNIQLTDIQLMDIMHGPIFSQRYFSFDQGMIYSWDTSSSDHGIGTEVAVNTEPKDFVTTFKMFSVTWAQEPE